MKLIFTGNKKLEKIEGESRTLDELFEDGFEIPLKGMEFPIELKEMKVYTANLSNPGEPKKEVHEHGIGTITIDCDYEERRIEAPVYIFGREQLLEKVIIQLKDRLLGMPKKKEAYERILGSKKWKDIHLVFNQMFGKLSISDKLGNVAISDEGLVIYEEKGMHATDTGTYVGTWVDGNKVGMSPKEWHPWDLLEKRENVNCNLVVMNRYTLPEDASPMERHCKEMDNRLFAVKWDKVANVYRAEEGIRRLMNHGVAAVKDGSEIILGKNTFGEDYKFRLEVD